MIGGAVDTQIHELFVEYYGNPRMTKLRDQDQSSIYVAKVRSMARGVNRYLMAFVPRDSNLNGTITELSELDWNVLHVRTLDDLGGSIPVFQYEPRKFIPLMKTIARTHKDGDDSYYDVDGLEVKVILLKPLNKIEYQPSGNLVSALETFNTVVYIP